MNPQKGNSGPQSFKLAPLFEFPRIVEKEIKLCRFGRIRQVAFCILPAVKSWRSESSNVSLVVLDKLLSILSKPLFWKITKLETNRQTDGQHYCNIAYKIVNCNRAQKVIISEIFQNSAWYCNSPTTTTAPTTKQSNHWEHHHHIHPPTTHHQELKLHDCAEIEQYC